MNPNGFIELNLCTVKNNRRPPTTIEEALAPLEKDTGETILIQGAPGMGKSMLLKQIAFRWAKQQMCRSKGEKPLLQRFQLVLRISLRERAFQEMDSVEELLKHFCEKDDEMHISEILKLLRSEDVALLLDGYDEFQNTSGDSIIVKILKREKLRQCTLIISSRPHAIAQVQKLCGSRCKRIEILGLTEDSQRAFIKQELDISDDVEQLQYIGLNNKFCEVPFNLVVLLCLYRYSESLPNNLSDLHKQIICFSIRRHLEKLGECVDGSFDFDNLLPPFDKYMKQLSEFCYRNINSKKMRYSFAEIKKSFQELSEADIRSFGLFKVVEEFKIGVTLAYEFVHVSVKEFLAAHYIDAHLPEDLKLLTLKEKFFVEHLSHMFALYMELSDGQHLRQFLSTTEQSCLSESFNIDKRKSLQLVCARIFQCLKQAAENALEGNDMREFSNLCDFVEDKLKRKIQFVAFTLSASDLEAIAFLLTNSVNPVWDEVCLMHCCVRDYGITILHQALKDHRCITISTLNLQNNNLTSKVDNKIKEIVINCRVKTLWIGYNAVGATEDFSTILSHSSCELELLEMHSSKLTSEAIKQIFDALQHYNPNNNRKLILDLSYNDITNETCDVIAPMLRNNKSLERLELSPASVKGAVIVLTAFENNTTLESLRLPTYSGDCTEISALQQQINDYRRASQVKELVFEHDKYYTLPHENIL